MTVLAVPKGVTVSEEPCSELRIFSIKRISFLLSSIILYSSKIHTNLSDEFLNDGRVLRTVVGNFSELFLGVIQNMSYVIVTSLKHLQTSLKHDISYDNLYRYIQLNTVQDKI